MPQPFKRGDVHVKNRISLRKSFHRSFNTFFTQQMQYGKRRTIGVVADVVRLSAIKLKLWVKAGKLNHTFQPMLFDDAFSDF